jgi:exodeoxyribonuclease V beta subunit
VFEHDGRYWIVDWKSNHLGERREDYTGAALAAAMDHHLYALQALIYTVALHRYLSLRLPDYDYERHMGGALYLFVRGVRPAWSDAAGSAGVHLERAPWALIEALDALLAGQSMEEAR